MQPSNKFVPGRPRNKETDWNSNHHGNGKNIDFCQNYAKTLATKKKNICELEKKLRAGCSLAHPRALRTKTFTSNLLHNSHMQTSKTLKNLNPKETQRTLYHWLVDGRTLAPGAIHADNYNITVLHVLISSQSLKYMEGL